MYSNTIDGKMPKSPYRWLQILADPVDVPLNGRDELLDIIECTHLP